MHRTLHAELVDAQASSGLRRLAGDVRDIARELTAFREVLFEITRRDLKLRYKQAVMGYLWAIGSPVVHMVVFALVLTRIARFETSVPYPVYAFTGLLPWNLFANSLRFSAVSLTGNSVLVKKIYFPREIFPYSAILVCLADFAVASTVLVALMAWYRIGVDSSVIYLPVVLLVQLLFTAAVSLLLAMSNLFFRDVKYLTELGLTVWMFLTSVLYPIDHIDGRLGALLKLNPMTPIIDAYRAVLLRGEPPAWGPLLVAAMFAVVLFAIASIAFHRAESYFAEHG